MTGASGVACSVSVLVASSLSSWFIPLDRRVTSCETVACDGPVEDTRRVKKARSGWRWIDDEPVTEISIGAILYGDLNCQGDVKEDRRRK